MHYSTYVGLFFGAVAAQDSAVVLNIALPQSTLTAVGSNAGATTYKNSCPSDAAGISAVPSELLQNPDVLATPTPTAKPRVRRQTASTSDISGYSFCEPFTLVQGPSNYQLHLTDPVPGAWTLDMACSWQGGAITEADLTCTVTQSGSVPGFGATGFTSTIVSQSELFEMEAFQTVAVVSASSGSGSPEVSASRTASGLGTASLSGSATASRSGATASSSTGLAPAGPLPTGALALVGAAGIFAAALAL